MFKMIQNLATRLEAAATRMREAGKQAKQHSAASILSLCMLAGAAASNVTYSQTPETAVAGAGVPLTLPADNVELFNINGRKIIGTVLSMAADKQSIVVRLSDGRETPILMSRLTPDTIRKLTGKAPAARLSQTEEKATNVANMKRIGELRKKFNQMTAKELMEKFKTNDPDLLFVMSVNGYIGILDYYDSRDPNLPSRFHPAIELLRKIEIKDGDETVSLRPEFERLGMVAHQQKENVCYQHASYHMYQYQLRKNKLPVPSYENFIQMTGGGAGDPLRILNLKLPDGRQLSAQHLALSGIMPLEQELIKHQLRNGKPCIVSGQFPQGSHVVLAIGFVVKNGKTEFEYLDSNRVWQDKGYRLSGPNISGRFTGTLSAWVE